MGNKIFGAVVLLLWGSSMAWLVGAKVLPNFFRGDPPRVAASGRLEPAAWVIELQGANCGLSVSQAVPGDQQTSEVHSRVILKRLPLPQLGTQWLWMQPLLSDLHDLRLDVRTKTTFDTFGRLATFAARIKANESATEARILGRVSDGLLKLNLRAGSYKHQTEHPWTGRSMLGGELAPQSKLLAVYVGKRWREEVYSPLSAPGAAAEVIEAEVTEEELLEYAGEITRVKRIVYRSVSAAGIAAQDRVRAIAWVRDDGQVIRQDVFVLNTRLRFTRLPELAARELAESLLELDKHASVTRPDTNRPDTTTAERERAGEPSP
ncbi:MAG: hypothetical protein AAF790_07340 [Planctomycetota bacterium]